MCVYVCRHDICIYMHVCMYSYIYAFIHVCMCMCVNIREQVVGMVSESVVQRVDSVMHAHVFSCVYTCVYICV